MKDRFSLSWYGSTVVCICPSKSQSLSISRSRGFKNLNLLPKKSDHPLLYKVCCPKFIILKYPKHERTDRTASFRAKLNGTQTSKQTKRSQTSLNSVRFGSEWDSLDGSACVRSRWFAREWGLLDCLHNLGPILSKINLDLYLHFQKTPWRRLKATRQSRSWRNVTWSTSWRHANQLLAMLRPSWMV